VALHQAVVIGIDGLQISLLTTMPSKSEPNTISLPSTRRWLMVLPGELCEKWMLAGLSPAQLISAQTHQRRDAQLDRVAPRTLALGIQVRWMME
jgi:hypothetical protein